MMEYHYNNVIEEKKPTIVFIHGAGGRIEQWNVQINFFQKQGFKTLAINLPGHGKSPRLEKISIENYSKAITTLFSDLQLNSLVLVGHSMGGGIVQHLAMNEGLRIHAIILIGTGAKLNVAPAIIEMISNNFNEAMNFMGQYAYSNNIDLKIIEQNERLIRSNGKEILLADFEACRNFDQRTEISRIKSPALIICGEKDQMTPVKFSTYLHEHIKNSRLEIIPSGGHYIFQEKPDEVNKIMLNFLLSIHNNGK